MQTDKNNSSGIISNKSTAKFNTHDSNAIDIIQEKLDRDDLNSDSNTESSEVNLEVKDIDVPMCPDWDKDSQENKLDAKDIKTPTDSQSEEEESIKPEKSSNLLKPNRQEQLKVSNELIRLGTRLDDKNQENIRINNTHKI